MRAGKREAQRALTAMVAEADTGTLARTDATVGELLERWFEQAKDDFSSKTVLETRGLHRPQPAARPRPVAAWEAQAPTPPTATTGRCGRETGTAGGRWPRPPSGAPRHLRRALSQGVRWGWLAPIRPPLPQPQRVVTRDIKPPAPAEVARLFTLAQEDDPELAVYVVMAAATGARRSPARRQQGGALVAFSECLCPSNAVGENTGGPD